jgi:hypothetical protein
MKKHTPAAFYKCSKCASTTDSQNRMREHFSVKHPSMIIDDASLQMGSKRKNGSGLKIEPCKYCGKVFEVNALEKHLWLHEDVNPYKCDICDYAARSKTYLTLHRQTHEANGSLFTCKTCGQGHKSEKMLISHIVATHFENNTCPQCGHVAANRGDFHCHLLIHSEKKSFACNICPTVLLQENKMEEHFRTKHYGVRVQYTSFINENPISIPDIADMERNPPPEAQTDIQPSEQNAADSASIINTDGVDQMGEAVAPNVQYVTQQQLIESSGLIQQQSAGDEVQFEMQADGTGDQQEETMIEINAAIKALIDAGHNIPEGAEIVIDNGTILIDGVPTAVITTDDGSSQLEQEIPEQQTDLMQQPHDLMAGADQPQETLQHEQTELVYEQSHQTTDMEQVVMSDPQQHQLMQG